MRFELVEIGAAAVELHLGAAVRRAGVKLGAAAAGLHLGAAVGRAGVKLGAAAAGLYLGAAVRRAGGMNVKSILIYTTMPFKTLHLE